MRPWLQKFLDTPAALGEACERLPPAVLARLAKTFLPEGDDVLRSPALAQALREFKESLDETPTPRVCLQEAPVCAHLVGALPHLTQRDCTCCITL